MLSNTIPLPSAIVTSSPAAIVPVDTAPVVVIVDEPVSIFPKPDVIEPESNAPVVTILELPAAGAAEISDNTSDADRPSTTVQSILRKSSSTTPAAN